MGRLLAVMGSMLGHELQPPAGRASPKWLHFSSRVWFAPDVLVPCFAVVGFGKKKGPNSNPTS